MNMVGSRYDTLLLQFKTQSVKSGKEYCIKVNTRELNRVSSIKYLPYIY